MSAFVLKGLTVSVAPPVSLENPSHDPLVILTLKDDESERDVKIPWRAWVQISQHVAKAGHDQLAGVLFLNLLESKRRGEGTEATK